MYLRPLGAYGEKDTVTFKILSVFCIRPLHTTEKLIIFRDKDSLLYWTFVFDPTL